ncbi:MAG: M23 family metallopeptidase [Chitinophagales bacterium]
MKKDIGLLALVLGILLGTLYLFQPESIEEAKAVMNLQSPTWQQENDVEYIQQAFDLTLGKNQSVHQDRIGKNQYLSDILLSCNVPYAKIDEVAKKSKETFDVRHLQVGKPYTILCDEDQQTATHFIYEQDKINYVVFDLQDSLRVSTHQRTVEIRERMAAGIIHNSLARTMQSQNLSPLLTLQLSDIFAWSIDFFHIQVEDKFKIIYDEKYVNGEFVGVGKVKAAWFEQADMPYYAFQFKQDSTLTYFDEDGNSCQKAFLKAPLRFSRISSRYSRKRYHPVLKRYKGHFGTDYAAPKGTPIRAVGDGVIVKKGYTRGNGNYIKIKHNGTYTTQYLHMSRFGKGMASGKRVRQSDVIGYVGSTGLATGPHLCFRFWKNGQQVDPFRQKLPPGKPIKEQYADTYHAYKDSMKIFLDNIAFPELNAHHETEALPTTTVEP